jgi:N utilization substance protein A
LGEQIIQKLVVAGITTVEALADMTPEQLEEIPGIGEKTLEKISLAVRHYFGEYEPGEERPAAHEGAMGKTESDEELVAKARAIEDAQVNEEIDALTLDQEGEREAPNTRDGSGRISDDIARDRIEELTESGPDLDEIGAIAETPGREDTSDILAEHNPNYDVARSEAVDDGNVEQASHETRQDAKVDEGGV